jgi:addiction module HigA family antidote
MTKDDSEDLKAPAGGFKMRRVHPGLTLAETIREHGLTAHALALKLRVPANRITGIVNGRRGITADTALRLARYFGTTAAFWMNLQSSYDLYVAERDLGEKIAAEVEKAA